jgi:2-polyprenyl-6-methoxyphenol hydroxylase-like FAD-dependent oxidoreductase
VKTDVLIAGSGPVGLTMASELGGIRASDPVWLSSFSINERKVSDYRSGRIFLAGDAAHVHSPAGGQGMNTGMQDAINLAWKLALVSRGICAPEPLLSSYSAERSAIAKLVLEATGKTTVLTVMKAASSSRFVIISLHWFLVLHRSKAQWRTSFRRWPLDIPTAR